MKVPLRRRIVRQWPAVPAAGASSAAEQAWRRSRRGAARWGMAGAALGIACSLVVFAPAAWLADAVNDASGGRVLLADARGSVWQGSAVPVLTGGAGSRDAAALPGRLAWSAALAGAGFEVRLRQDCCLNGTATLRLTPGLGRFMVALLPPAGGNTAPGGLLAGAVGPGPGALIGQWPTAWLVGLGTPWNTLQLGGVARLASPGLVVERVAGRWRVDGQAELELRDVSSRLSTLDVLGSYRLAVAGSPGATAQFTLATVGGALQLSGAGSAGPNGVRFRGEARAAAGDEAVLSNLLNIIGRRDGARSVLSIG